MKISSFTVFMVVAILSAKGFNKCPKATRGSPPAPRAGKYYQVMKDTKNSKETCYNLKISRLEGKRINIDRSMLLDAISLKYSYTADPNMDETWDVVMDGEIRV